MTNVTVAVHDGVYYLQHEHLSGNHHLYSIRLCRLLPNEVTLRQGRFHRFAGASQDNKTYLRRAIPTDEMLQHMMGELLDWIALHVNHRWSFSVRMHSVHEATLIFEFSEISDSVHFALVWS